LFCLVFLFLFYLNYQILNCADRVLLPAQV